MNLLKQYEEIAEYMANSFSSLYEIILIDLRKKELPVVRHYNRIVGVLPELRKLIKSKLKDERVMKKGKSEGNFLATNPNKLIKSSVKFIFDNEGAVSQEDENGCGQRGKPIAALCVNYKCTMLLQLRQIIEDMTTFDIDDEDDAASGVAGEKSGVINGEITNDVPVKVSKNYVEPSFALITQMVEEFTDDVSHMTPSDRIDLICDMYYNGIFELKGAVPKVAQALQISTQSVYRIVSDIKKS